MASGVSVGVRFLKGCLIAAVVGLMAVPAVSYAKPMEALVKDGFKVSKLTHGKSGRAGWNLTKRDQTYFCPARPGIVYVDSKKAISLTATGRQIALDRKTFDDYIGGPDPTIPYWKDVLIGRVGPNDVDPCVPTK